MRSRKQALPVWNNQLGRRLRQRAASRCLHQSDQLQQMDRSEDSPGVHHRWSHVSSEMTFKARPHVEAFAGEYFRLWLCM